MQAAHNSGHPLFIAPQALVKINKAWAMWTKIKTTQIRTSNSYLFRTYYIKGASHH